MPFHSVWRPARFGWTDSSPDPFRRWQEVGVNTKPFTVAVVDHAEQANAAAVGELIMHEVHRLGFVDLRGHSQRQRLLSHHTVTRFDPQELKSLQEKLTLS